MVLPYYYHDMVYYSIDLFYYYFFSQNDNLHVRADSTMVLNRLYPGTNPHNPSPSPRALAN